jgi:hypothetical protein
VVGRPAELGHYEPPFGFDALDAPDVVVFFGFVQIVFELGETAAVLFSGAPV